MEKILKRGTKSVKTCKRDIKEFNKRKKTLMWRRGGELKGMLRFKEGVKLCKERRIYVKKETWWKIRKRVISCKEGIMV